MSKSGTNISNAEPASADRKAGVYENCPVLENEKYKIRLIEDKDADELLEVYGDRSALPFFNSDNCHGSNFYCGVKKDMENMIKYWLIEYHENKGFVRFSIEDKIMGKVIGTIEMFRREAEDYFTDCGILRLDVRSSHERPEPIHDILTLVSKPFFDWFECSKIATKAPVYAIDRIEALKRAGFTKSEEPLIGHQQNIAYYDYWVCHRSL